MGSQQVTGGGRSVAQANSFSLGLRERPGEAELGELKTLRRRQVGLAAASEGAGLGLGLT